MDFREGTDLINAINEGDLKEIKRLIKEGENVNEVDEDGETALTVAVDYKDRKKQLKIVKTLIKAGAKVKVRNKKSPTALPPLHFAAYKKNYPLVKLLIKAGSDVNSLACDGQSPLFSAEGAKITKLLLKKGASLDLIDSSGWNVLMKAASDLDVEKVKFLINSEKFVKNTSLALTLALSQNCPLELVELLVRAGANVNYQDEDGKTPLMFACQNCQNSAVINFLIDSGANTELKTKFGWSALTYALLNANFAAAELLKKGSISELLDYLITDGLDLEAEGEDELTPLNLSLMYYNHGQRNNEVAKALIYAGAKVENEHLAYAVASDDLDLVKLIIEKGADIFHRDDEGQTAFYYAALNCANPKILHYLASLGANVNEKNDYQETPLMVAIRLNDENPQIVKTLIDLGADLEARDKFGQTALFDAVRFCSNAVELTKLLLKAGAKADVEDSSGHTPLIEAIYWARKKELKLIKLLVDAGADINHQNENGWSALAYACRYTSEPEFAKTLIAMGANVNNQDKDNWTPLMLECRYFRREGIIKLLIEKGANPNVINKIYNNSILNLALRNVRKKKIIKLLLEAGADVNYHQEKQAWCPLMFAVRYNKLSVVKLLLKYGANPNLLTKDNGTALMYATSYRTNPKFTKILLEAGADISIKDNEGCTALDYAKDNNRKEAVKLIKEIQKEQCI